MAHDPLAPVGGRLRLERTGERSVVVEGLRRRAGMNAVRLDGAEHRILAQ